MENRYTLEKFIFAASLSRDVQSLQNNWSEFVSVYGFCGYRIVPATIPMLKKLYDLIEFDNKPKIHFPNCTIPLTNFNTAIDIACKTPPGWREYYHEQRFYRFDPLLVKEIICRGPFTRSEAIAEFSSPASRKLIDLSKDTGIYNSLTMSYWLNPNILVGISIYFPFFKLDLNEMTRRIIQTAATVFCARYQEIAGELPLLGEGSSVSLTPRECDVLQWIALGKTKHQIAEILNVTTSTVKRHCENACQKLGAINMANAVAKAMAYGLIRP